MNSIELQRLHRFLVIIRSFCVWPAAILAVVSASTIFWASVNGQMVLAERELQKSEGGSVADGMFGRYGGTFHWVKAIYSYTVDGENYNSRFVCICLPIGFNLPDAGEEVRVYYVPALPALSVLFRGPDVLLIGLLLIFGAGAGVAASRLRNMEYLSQEKMGKI